MGDHFVLLVDRLLTESTLEAAIESRNRLLQATNSTIDDVEIENSSRVVNFEDISTPRKLVECRICQDEDIDSNMETPCSCCGSLKYAHRRCIQRWCNEKGNTICEICQQQFKPGYTAPPPLFQLGHIPANFRGNWVTSRRELHGPRIIAVVTTDRNLLSRANDDYPTSTTRYSIWCRLLAVIFMALLILRHTLPLILNSRNEFSFPLVMLIFLRTAGIILPLYVMVKAIIALQRCYQQEPPNALSDASTEEAEQTDDQNQTHIINIRA